MLEHGKDLPEGAVEAALKKGRCPRCGAEARNLRGTNMSGFTMEARGICYRSGEISHGFKCNAKKKAN